MKLILAYAIACSFVGALGEDQEQQNAGTYEGKITSFENCGDAGKNFYSVEAKFDEEKDVFNGVFYKKESLGDNVMVTIDLQHQVGGEWKKEFSQNFGGLCMLMKGAPDAVRPFLEAMNINDCPINEGTNIIKNLKNSFLMPFMKEMKYGPRQGEITFTDKDGTRLGCLAIKGEVIPKTE